MDDAEAFGREMRSQALILALMQAELKGTTADVSELAHDFREYVTHVKTGVVVQLRHLERNVEQDRQAMEFVVKEAEKVPGLVARIAALELAADKKADGRTWLKREILGVGLMLIATSVLTALIVVKFLGN